MMNENTNELNEKIVALTEEELAGVTGGKHSYIEGDYVLLFHYSFISEL